MISEKGYKALCGLVEVFSAISSEDASTKAAEEVHANNHLKVLKGIKSTNENLQAAISGEDEEWKEMYPAMIEAAKSEGKKASEMTFHYANEVEKIHSQLYNKILESLGKSQEAFPYYICPYCGNTVEREAPGVCSVCGAEGKLFFRVD